MESSDFTRTNKYKNDQYVEGFDDYVITKEMINMLYNE